MGEQRLDPGTVAKSRYRYVRVAIKGKSHDGLPVEVILGVELTAGLLIAQMYSSIRERFAQDERFTLGLHSQSDDVLAEIAEEIILHYWPTRSYFIEVGRGENDQWIQVFTP